LGAATIALPGDSQPLKRADIATKGSDTRADPSRSYFYRNRKIDLTITCGTANPTAAGCHAHAATSSGGHFVLENCGPVHGHVWKQIDAARFRESEPSPSPAAPPKSQQNNSNRLLSLGAADNTTLVTFSIKFYYTSEFAAVTPDIDGFIGEIIAETNQGYANSHVPLRAYALCHERATIPETRSARDLLTQFVTMKGENSGSSTAALLDTADSAQLLAKELDYCGLGFLDSIAASGTVSVVMKSCAVGYYSSGHEIGHHFGLQHDQINLTGPHGGVARRENHFRIRKTHPKTLQYKQ
jgi:hypothetical protein